MTTPSEAGGPDLSALPRPALTRYSPSISYGGAFSDDSTAYMEADSDGECYLVADVQALFTQEEVRFLRDLARFHSATYPETAGSLDKIVAKIAALLPKESHA